VLVTSSIHGLSVLCVKSRNVRVRACVAGVALPGLSLCLHCGMAHLRSLLGWVNSRSALVSHWARLSFCLLALEGMTRL
jgi:hypothetical protein